MINFEIISSLAQNTGTGNYYSTGPLFRNCLITDGMKEFAEKCQAWWLIDLVCSHTMKPKLRNYSNGLIEWTIKDTFQSKATVYSEDGERRVLTRQNVPFTDFFQGTTTINRFSFFASSPLESGTGKWVFFLKSEY